MNGGCTVIGIGSKEQLTPASNARVGDRVIMTKGAAIEAAGILAYQAEKVLKDKLGEAVVEKAKRYFLEMTVIKDALTAAPYAHAMHDATEGGLLNGVYEVAAASEIGVTLYEEKIVVPPEIESVCHFFSINPLISISEGTLVITASPEKAPQVLSRLKQEGIGAWEIGEMTARDRVLVRRDGKREPLEPVSVDPFWAAYFSTLES